MFRSALSRIRALFSRQQDESASDFDPRLFIYVMIPEDIQPIARGEKYEDALSAKLESAGLGEVTGGGSQLDGPNPDGSVRIAFCGLDVEVNDAEKARELMRRELPPLGIPVGTELHFTTDSGRFLDRFQGERWILSQPREMLHPGFDI